MAKKALYRDLLWCLTCAKVNNFVHVLYFGFNLSVGETEKEISSKVKNIFSDKFIGLCKVIVVEREEELWLDKREIKNA